MRRIGWIVALFPLLCGVPGALRAEAAPEKPAVAAKAQTAGRAPADNAIRVKLGESAVELMGPWKFHTGDDMAWAEPAYDDSGWADMDLTPPPGTADASLGTSGYIPGWTSRGYPHHAGYAWYRLQVDVEGATRSLALKMPDNADDAYQVFVNGLQIGEFGTFAEKNVTAYSTLPQAFRLPKGLRNGKATIAIRMWMDSATPFNSPDAGGLHGPPVLGYATVIATQVQLDWDDIAHGVGSGFLEGLILIMALVMGLALFWLDPQEDAYLWLSAVCFVTLLGNGVVLSVNFIPWIGQTSGVILNDVILTPLRIGLWVLFWAYWFRLWQMGRLHAIVWTQVALLAVGTAMLRPPLYGQHVPVEAAGYLVPLLLAIKLGLGVVLFAVAYRGFRRQRAEGWMAGVAILLVVVANYQHELRLIHVRTTTSLFGFAISLGTVATILSLLLITVMLLRRFIESQARKEHWKLEIEQARHVQQVLIPEMLPQIKGLSIESEYRPAREVGGDFFQILPGEEPGTALIVVGDVTGKGMQAGMLVALIVGSIRTAAQNSSDPQRILSQVNDQLCEREHSSATCVVLRIMPDGMVHLANAGQLPPYLNDKEVEMEGALPLGIVPEMEFPVVSFRLEEGDSLILMSDGIAEAQDAQGQLFGFERVNELLRQPITAAEIAKIAQDFGQEDDILVLRIQRDGQPRQDARSSTEMVAH
ncbi:PP2C family protein-serine/threonine phosphatase [Edaphobacter bradus]|uniref:PP2C family protein-serine/threonine phosphatase n=1 Tax=Edaphobacter bradus TaxID=2259016 RepID=UPI0021E055FF|nr:SpoIIE family protein phosphatase [Edaphobacter bradus]